MRHPPPSPLPPSLARTWGGLRPNPIQALVPCACRYDDKGSRWTGTINFAGDIFPRLRNWTANNRATSVGSQLLNNYRK